jgi:hypothetical protein
MLKSCQKKVDVNLGGAAWKHPDDIKAKFLIY